MGERTSYTPGTFSWAELATSDAEDAKRFYSALFGWEYDDNPIGDDLVYSMARREGRNVAALYQSDQPPHWNCYVTVESADDAARRAADAGGRVLQEPFDVMDVGRMAVVADPAGAALVRVGAAPEHRRRARQHARRDDLERPRHERPRRARSGSTASSSAGASTRSPRPAATT